MTKLQYPLCGPQVCLQRAACGPRAACLTCLALGIQHANRMRHTVICGLPDSTLFFRIIS